MKPETGNVKAENLAEKHKGMRVSAKGFLLRVRGEYSGTAQEMLGHLTEMADRFYSGDVKAVDEFCQLYCLDAKRPKDEVKA